MGGVELESTSPAAVYSEFRTYVQSKHISSPRLSQISAMLQRLQANAFLTKVRGCIFKYLQLLADPWHKAPSVDCPKEIQKPFFISKCCCCSKANKCTGSLIFLFAQHLYDHGFHWGVQPLQTRSWRSPLRREQHRWALAGLHRQGLYCNRSESTEQNSWCWWGLYHAHLGFALR